MGSNSNGSFSFEQSGGMPPPGSSFLTDGAFLGSHSASLKSASSSALEMVETFSTCWDALVPVDGNAGFAAQMPSQQQGLLYPLIASALESQPGGINLVPHHPSAPLLGSTPPYSCYLNGKCPDNGSSFGILGSTRVSTIGSTDYQFGNLNQCNAISPSPGDGIQASGKDSEGNDHGIAGQEEEQKTENRFGDSPSDRKKRKRMPDGVTTDPNQKSDNPQRIESDQSKDTSYVSNDSVKTPKEQTPCGTLGKLAVKQSKDHSQNGDAPKEDFVHVRARRGQATNSHSLAERVRREKISERMRFLQDLVPGCSKVTGKAVMLDEIINYVQSLQRQVEFLSMKLATVNPQLDFDIEGIIAKDIFRSGGHGSAAIGFSPNISSSCHHIGGTALESGLRTETVRGVQNFGEPLRRSINSKLSEMDKGPNTWDYELQNAAPEGFMPQAHLSILEQNANSKVDY
ncbi:unnamed protein product [Victoria cruziana]